jgi:C1A family cysteine protease
MLLSFAAPTRTLPPSCDNSSADTSVKNQESTSSCLAFATISMIENIVRRNGLPDADYSELYLYWNMRVRSGSRAPDEDTGAKITEAIDSIERYGGAHEQEWPFHIDNIAKEPPVEAYNTGILNQVIRSINIQPDVISVKEALLLNRVVVVGLRLTDTQAATRLEWPNGRIPIPLEGEPWRCGHAVLIVGYDDDPEKGFKFKNSWSADWGQLGYGWIPYRLFSGETATGRGEIAISECFTVLEVEYESDARILTPAGLTAGLTAAQPARGGLLFGTPATPARGPVCTIVCQT